MLQLNEVANSEMDLESTRLELTNICMNGECKISHRQNVAVLLLPTQCFDCDCIGVQNKIMEPMRKLLIRYLDYPKQNMHANWSKT